ncbi:MAG: TIGR03899 family protein [Vibrio sp.]
MADNPTPVVIEHDTPHNQEQRTQSQHLKDSASRILGIARQHGLDSLLLSETPKTSLLERAIQRERRHKELRQKNLEQIIKLAHSSCRNESSGDPDPDWLYRFFDMAQDIHSRAMQQLWAQVLKREVTNPGFTSMKALKVLKNMTPKEAQILQRAASLACSFGASSSLKLLIGYKVQHSLLSFAKRITTQTINIGSHQLPYSSLLVLIELGLLHATELESGEIETDPPLLLNYQGKHLQLQPHSKAVRLIYYRFSPTGNELCRLLGNKFNQTYYDQLIALLNQKFTLQTEVSNSMHHAV